jgi:asparagine synthase (glutamine-hydrolysing)
VKALLAGGGVDTTPDPAGRAGFFLWGHVPEPHTLFKGIKALPAGSYLLARRGGLLQIRTFCDVFQMLGEEQTWSEKISTAELLRESVRRHLLADVPVGVFLSSGIDSCTLAALAVEHSRTPVCTVTLGMTEYRGQPQDETVLAEEMSRYYGTRHNTVWLSEQDFRDQFERLIESMDQPSIDGVNTYFVSLAAARSGLKVALSGLGGDEIFGGYSDFRRIPALVSALQPFSKAPRFARSVRAVMARPLEAFGSPKYASVFEYGGTYGGAYLLTRSLFLPWELQGVIDADMAAEGIKQLQIVEQLDATAAQLASPRLKVSALQMKWYMQNQLLRDADWAGMAHGVEIRVPFVDLQLIAQLQPLLASADPPRKASVAAAPSRPLPEKIVKRPKTGFSIPVDRWLPAVSGKKRVHSGLKDWAKFVYERHTARAA